MVGIGRTVEIANLSPADFSIEFQWRNKGCSRSITLKIDEHDTSSICTSSIHELRTWGSVNKHAAICIMSLRVHDYSQTPLDAIRSPLKPVDVVR